MVYDIVEGKVEREKDRVFLKVLTFKTIKTPKKINIVNRMH